MKRRRRIDVDRKTQYVNRIRRAKAVGAGRAVATPLFIPRALARIRRVVPGEMLDAERSDVEVNQISTATGCRLDSRALEPAAAALKAAVATRPPPELGTVGGSVPARHSQRIVKIKSALNAPKLTGELVVGGTARICWRLRHFSGWR